MVPNQMLAHQNKPQGVKQARNDFGKTKGTLIQPFIQAHTHNIVLPVLYNNEKQTHEQFHLFLSPL